MDNCVTFLYAPNLFNHKIFKNWHILVHNTFLGYTHLMKKEHFLVSLEPYHAISYIVKYLGTFVFHVLWYLR